MALLDSLWLDDIFKQEKPTGLVNDVNTNFSLSILPHSHDGVVVFLNGIPQELGVDFTLDGGDPRIIVFTTAPATGQSVYCWYVKGKV